MIEGKVSKGTTLFRESSQVDFVYFIIKGSVKYTKCFDSIVKPTSKYLKLLTGKVDKIYRDVCRFEKN